jgi:hypothetical protein
MRQQDVAECKAIPLSSKGIKRQNILPFTLPVPNKKFLQIVDNYRFNACFFNK